MKNGRQVSVSATQARAFAAMMVSQPELVDRFRSAALKAVSRVLGRALADALMRDPHNKTLIERSFYARQD